MRFTPREEKEREANAARQQKLRDSNSEQGIKILRTKIDTKILDFETTKQQVKAYIKELENKQYLD